MKKLILLLYCSMAALTALTQNDPWLLNENFADNKNAWVIKNDPGHDLHISNGIYTMHCKNDTGMSTTKYLYVTQADDYKIEAEIESVSGNEKLPCGITFGFEKGNAIYFLLARDGYYKIIQQVSSDNIKNIKDFTYSDAAITGVHYNKLSVIKTANTWSFRINDDEVYSCAPVPFAGNSAGFFIPGGSKIQCRSFKIYDWTIADKYPGSPKELTVKKVFSDDFLHNDNNWGIYNDEGVSSILNDSIGYAIKRKTAGYFMPTIQMPISNFLDFKIVLAATHLDGKQDESFGLSFSSDDPKNTFIFSISGDGSFHIGKFVKGDWNNIKSWTQSSALNQGDLKTNVLAFEKIKDTWNFYINNELVYTCDHQPLFNSRMGVYVEDEQTVLFTDLKVFQFEKR